MAQYPVPQYIEEEGKIIYFLTFKQFFMIVGGGAILFILYYTVPFKWFELLGLCVAAITAAIAFLKINGLPILVVLWHMLKFTMGSKVYVWKKKDREYPYIAVNTKSKITNSK